MSSSDHKYTGVWLHEGSRRGQAFTHSDAEYHHAEDPQDTGNQQPGGATRMRHVHVDQEGSKVGVWVPEGWSEEETRQALESNW